jgi:hypothetical protein
LLDKTGKGSLKISELGKKILVPTNSEERRAAIAEAAARPVLYRKLIEKYRDSAIPTMLPNLLIREHGVFPGSAENAARSFRETVEFAGLLRNGVLYGDAGVEVDPALSMSERVVTPGSETRTDPSSRVASGTPSTVEKKLAGTQGYTVPLDQTGRVATITIPIPVTRRDLRKIGAWITYASDNVFDEEQDQAETATISSN